MTEMIVWTARKPFLDKNRAAMVDFMEDTLRIVRWYLDPANQKEVAEIAGAGHQAAAGAFRLAVHQAATITAIPNMIPDLVALQKNVDMTKDLGFIRASLDVKKYTDLSIVEEAAKRLK